MDAQKITNPTFSSRSKIRYSWMFVSRIPIMITNLQAARQFEVEVFLNPKGILEQIGVTPTETQTGDAIKRYVT